jgi:hypothetical protein
MSMQNASRSSAFVETPESFVFLETPAVALAPSTSVRRLKMMIAGVVIAGLAAAAISGADSPVESETTRWQRVTEAAVACSNLDPGTAAEIQCRVEAGTTP